MKNTTISSISYCKAVRASSQMAVNGKGQAEGRRTHADSIPFPQRCACCTSMILLKLKLSPPSSEQLLLTSGPHLMTHPKLDLLMMADQALSWP